ncbi:isoquinoline 1-oxidoreductase [Paramagnetospirillum marisnigri]|uniref:Isoquinoline 1-oxidoreductase n=1 Tax=Paramagnetospirillum marisnigri TaxID=1285242 RepID=A0A178MHQ2_9PROT|nr:(2Fe-2S)-binding protein [Paramagnetospirillum marisnigri]OAN48206.1 isoquinoline 1-oxidoreductase [Paramagnetospirillum marisnigri]
MISLNVNGERRKVDAAPDMPLLWVLRDHLGLNDIRFGCGQSLCGACTVLVDGAPMRACSTPVGEVAGRKITTQQGLDGPVGKALKAAWIELDVAQCGYCQGGQLLSAAALLRQTPRPSDADIDTAMTGNLCRCGTYGRIRAAIHLAARRLGGAS